MEIGNRQLLDILLEFDRFLTRKMTIIAIGGTALTLLGKKASTKDIDFCFINEKNKELFKRSAKKLGYVLSSHTRLLGNGLAIDCYSSGHIFCIQLPEDYTDRAKKIQEMQKIDLRVLDPIDLIITKAARFNDRDKEDLLVIIRNYPISQGELVERWVGVMANSLVRDAKENLYLLLALFKQEGKLDQAALRKAKKWFDE